MVQDIHARSLRLLEPWVAQARRHFHRLAGTDAVCYGLGHRGHWAVQAHDTAFSALAVLAVDPQTDFGKAGMSRDEMLDTARAMCRFTFRSHHVGGGTSTDGKTWGHSWISVLGLERMMHGVRAIRHHLTDEDLATMQRVLVSEADWLLDHYPVTAGLIQNNHPESNMWNGVFLHRVARMYPGELRVKAYLEKGTSFLANAISIPSDAESGTLIDGKPLREWHIGPNFTESYGCNHHGYMNVGYMVITLSNLALFHFACKEEGWTAPEMLYLHADDLWQVVRTCTFPDGRLWRIGGDSRVRYCYCQDYAIPVWMFAQDRFGDQAARVFEERWLDQVEVEGASSGDGSFLGRRLAKLDACSPLYYTRLEGDKACTLGMAVWWRRVFDDFKVLPVRSTCSEMLPAWSDELHGASLVREEKRLASWTWLASEAPQGLCLSPDGSDMAEWRYSLGGRIRGQGAVNIQKPVRHTSMQFPGGFATCGRVSVSTDIFVSEGDLEGEVAILDVAFAALPDGRTVVGMQRAVLPYRAPLAEIKGLHLPIPNDVQNRYVRQYAGACGVMQRQGYPGQDETIFTGGLWLCADDRLGVLGIYGGAELILYRPKEPQVVIKPTRNASHGARCGGLLYADEICLGACSEQFGVREAGPLFDVGFAVRAGASAAETELWSQKGAKRIADLNREADIRAMLVPGAEGCLYLVVTNFGENLISAGFANDWHSSVVVDGGEPVREEGGTLLLAVMPAATRVIRLAE